MTDTTERAPDAPVRGGIDIERYAEVMVHVRHFGKTNTPEVLERLDLDEDRWEEAVFGFTALLVEESEREEETLSKRFGERFAKTKVRLGQEKPALASIGRRHGQEPIAAPAAALVPPASVPAPPQSAPPITPAAPIALQPLLHQAPAVADDDEMSPWARSSSVPPMPLPVVSPMPAAPLHIATQPSIREMPMPAGMRNFKSLQGTSGPALDAPTKAALPFASDTGAAEPDAAFRRAIEHAAITEPSRSQPLHLGHVGAETKDISAVVAAVMAQKKPVPFDREKPLTKTVQPVVASAVMSSAPVVPEPALPEPISLTIEQYASLCVEISMAPANKQEIAQRYGLSEERALYIDAYWRRRIASEPEVDQSFRWAYHSYQQWLARR